MHATAKERRAVVGHDEVVRLLRSRAELMVQCPAAVDTGEYMVFVVKVCGEQEAHRDELTVVRRYRQFKQLHDALEPRVVDMARLPPRRHLVDKWLRDKRNPKHVQFVKERQQGLQGFLQQLLSNGNCRHMPETCNFLSNARCTSGLHLLAERHPLTILEVYNSHSREVGQQLGHWEGYRCGPQLIALNSLAAEGHVYDEHSESSLVLPGITEQTILVKNVNLAQAFLLRDYQGHINPALRSVGIRSSSISDRDIADLRQALAWQGDPVARRARSLPGIELEAGQQLLQSCSVHYVDKIEDVYDIHHNLGDSKSWAFATQRDNDNGVALKRLCAAASAYDKDLVWQRVHRLVALRHPHIAEFVQAHVTKTGELWLAVEFVAGGSLEQLLLYTTLPEAAIAGVCECVLSALAFAHSAGLVHGHVNLGRVLVTLSGEVKLAGFHHSILHHKDQREVDFAAVGRLVQEMAQRSGVSFPSLSRPCQDFARLCARGTPGKSQGNEEHLMFKPPREFVVVVPEIFVTSHFQIARSAVVGELKMGTRVHADIQGVEAGGNTRIHIVLDEGGDVQGWVTSMTTDGRTTLRPVEDSGADQRKGVSATDLLSHAFLCTKEEDGEMARRVRACIRQARAITFGAS